jgi:hypothetical protein
VLPDNWKFRAGSQAEQTELEVQEVQPGSVVLQSTQFAPLKKVPTMQLSHFVSSHIRQLRNLVPQG